ncbi:MAG: pantoate--beta-alanine ligase [Paracoccaceae bacterium]
MTTTQTPTAEQTPQHAPIIRRLPDLRTLTRNWQRAGDVIGVVPTMGALHPGHLSLVQAAQAQCDRVIVTIFVNPKQFNNPDDLAHYPRTETDDAQKLSAYAVDAIWAPDPDQVYPDGFATKVTVDGLTDVLCGAERPGHFDGVATVVTKLFLQTGAHRAFFGEKDYQQLQVVTRLARDLDVDITVVPCPTVRDPDGLAMSSRNLRLGPADRAAAVALPRTMQTMAQALRTGTPPDTARKTATGTLVSAGFDTVEYLDLRDGATLSLLDAPAPNARLFAAAWIGGVRLIDNIAL